MMLSPYSAKAIALQILFRRIRRGPLARRRIRRRYFFNDRRWSHVDQQPRCFFLLFVSFFVYLVLCRFSSFTPFDLLLTGHGNLVVIPGKDFAGTLPDQSTKTITNSRTLWRFYRAAAALARQTVHRSRNCNVCSVWFKGEWFRGIEYFGVFIVRLWIFM